MISRAKYAAPTMNAATRRPRRVDRAVGRAVDRDAVDYVPTLILLMHVQTNPYAYALTRDCGFPVTKVMRLSHRYYFRLKNS